MITGRVDFILKSFFCIKANTSLSNPIDIPVAGQSRFPKLFTRLSYLPPPPITNPLFDINSNVKSL